MIKLYTQPLSPYSAKIRLALREKGLVFGDEQLPISRAGILHKPEPFLRANPRGQVPVLFDGELVLYDSTVIFEYLDERYPEPALMPEDVVARARARLLEDDADSLMSGAILDLLAETYRKTDPSTRDDGKIVAAAKVIGAAHGRIEAVLADGRQYLCGPGLSFADIATFLSVSIAAFFGVAPGEGQPRLREWLLRMSARPSVSAETKAMQAALGALPD